MSDPPRLYVQRGGRWWWKAWIVRGRELTAVASKRDPDFLLFGSRARAESHARSVLARARRREVFSGESFEVREL